MEHEGKRMTTHRERIETSLSNGIPDRVPVAIWRHFPVDDQNPEALAAATVAWQKTFDLDLVKVTPASSFCIKDWGARDDWRGSSEGTRDYTHRVIQHPEDWTKLRVLDPKAGYIGAQLECLRLIVKELGPSTPVIQTIFSPLAQAKNLAGGGNLLVHIRSYPDAVRAGLKVITESIQLFIEEAQKTGIAGIFYAIQHAQFSLLSTQEFASFGRVNDLQALEPAQGFWLNMAHLHGLDVMFDEVTDYPLQILNWHDRETFPSLSEGLKRFPGVVCGGIQREKTLLLGDSDQVKAEAFQAIKETGGRRFILGTGCVVHITAPYGNLLALRLSVDLYNHV
jgi:uroporphyrinogen decarboxylase